MGLVNGVNLTVLYYIFVLIFGTIIIYFFDLKKVWQKKRILLGLVSEDCKQPPTMSLKRNDDIGLFLTKSCLRLAFGSFLFSVFILLILLVTSSRNFASLDDYLSDFFQCIIYYSAFISSSGTKEQDIDGHIKRAMATIEGFKLEIIDSIVYNENEFHKRFIRCKINDWLTNRNDKLAIEFGVLVLRIKDDYLLGLLPQREGIREAYNDLKQDVVDSYCKNASTFPDRLTKFLLDMPQDMRIKMYATVDFINTVEQAKTQYKTIDTVNELIGELPKNDYIYPVQEKELMLCEDALYSQEINLN